MVVDGSRSNHLDSVLSPKNCCLIAELFPDLALQRMERYVFMFDFCICQCQNRYQIDAGHPKDLIYSRGTFNKLKIDLNLSDQS